jgi:hypothetical protein
MERRPVDSTNIISAGYDPATETLELEFKGGVVWQYPHFPEQMWYEFEASPSKGKYFASQIRPRFGDFGYRVQ